MRNGFSLTEVIVVMIILGFVGVMVIPRFINFEGPAHEAVETQTVGAIKAGIITYYVDPSRGNYSAYPSYLDTASFGDASGSNEFFDIILNHGITRDWRKTAANVYLYVPTNNSWAYNVSVGIFSAN